MGASEPARVVRTDYMRRNVLIILGALVLAWGVLAIALGSASLKLDSGSSASAALSPRCLPATLSQTATLAGTDVDVSPAPQTGSADPHTQISFLGAPASQIRDVTVVGQRSGGHTGQLHAYSQGDGASFAPVKPFDAGERVDVSALIGAGAGRRASFSFAVDTPYPTASVKEFETPQAAPADYQTFYSQPGMQAPIMTVTKADADPAAGDILTTNGPGPGQFGPLIYSPQGRLIWFGRLAEGNTAENLSEQSYEGRRVLTWWKGRVLSLGFGQGEDVVMDSRYRTVARVRGGNGLPADLHDFQLAPHGIAYITAYNPIRCDLSTVGGIAGGSIVDTAIEQVDMRTGLVRWEWHSLDHIGAEESEVEAPNDTLPWDYVHINSIDPQSDGNMLISARSTWAGYLLQGGSGRVIWRVGGNKSSFKMGPGTKMAWQHDGRLLADGELSFFDDGANPPIHQQSRALRIKLDFNKHTATLAAAYTHRNPPLLAASQGNAQPLPSGATLVGYGGVPAISEYAADGTLLFDAHQPYDMSFYRAFRFPWSGHPMSPPSLLASLNDTGEETIVYASWNGATDVASWRVLAGKRAGALAQQAVIAATGFESSITLPKKQAFVAVQALDAGGHVLATSSTVRPIAYKDSLARAVGAR
ncbi:MAG TPA: arylsulfotransferase family protein [Solirubrobacteraceae bacterium]|nr:arylsulfotransferase family protein [Solirubrobacteraceae bacterium]